MIATTTPELNIILESAEHKKRVKPAVRNLCTNKTRPLSSSSSSDSDSTMIIEDDSEYSLVASNDEPTRSNYVNDDYLVVKDNGEILYWCCSR